MPKTLIIDDDPTLKKQIDEHLAAGKGFPGSAAGGTFLFAHNDEEAIAIMEAAEDGDIEVAAVTIDSPVISGMDVFTRLKDKKIRVPRIALTWGEELEVIREAMNKGAVDFLTKPITIEDLSATLQKVYNDCEERRRAWRNEAELSAIRREMDLASTLQQRILPDTFPQTKAMEFYARTTPARAMGGDFYDFFDLDEHRIGIVVADVSGKGVPAAFYMAMVRTLMRANAVGSSGPGDCLEMVNVQLSENNIPGMFVTMFYGVLDTRTWKLQFSNGGHLPPYRVRAMGDGNNAVEPVEGGEGVVLGFDHNVPYTQNEITLEKGDALFIYTDGLTEAFDKDHNQFSDERLMECLLDNRDRGAHALADNVFAFVNHFAGDEPQSDDITSFVIKRF